MISTSLVHTGIQRGKTCASSGTVIMVSTILANTASSAGRNALVRGLTTSTIYSDLIIDSVGTITLSKNYENDV